MKRTENFHPHPTYGGETVIKRRAKLFRARRARWVIMPKELTAKQRGGR